MISRTTTELVDIILGELYGTLVRNMKGKYETVTPEKQLLVGLSYLSNMQSMRGDTYSVYQNQLYII